MRAPPSAEEIERFRAAIAQQLGLAFDATKNEQLIELLARRAVTTRFEHVADYVVRVASGVDRAELATLAEQLTVGETYFFRNFDQYAALLDVVIPELMFLRRDEKQLSLLSAGCSTGEEAYSLEILLRERFPELSEWKVRVHGVDVNATAIERARSARYSSWSLRATSPEVQQRCFISTPEGFVVRPELRSAVTFEQENLVASTPSRWTDATFDVVFCRNTIMYFDLPHARQVISLLTAALKPGGYLFLGHAETLRGISESFDLCHSHRTFYYRLKNAARRRSPERPEVISGWKGSDPSEALAPVPPRWSEEIEGAAKRVERLTVPRPASPSPPATAALPKDHLQEALLLFKHERYADSLARIKALSPGEEARPETRLVRAVLLAQNGHFEEAETSCGPLIGDPAVSAMAHHLVAICREHAEDWIGAAEHEEAAAQRDPTFALPRLHLGRLARRSRDLTAARRELAQALALLPQEDEDRILLFGGGFTREALARACSAELKAAGVAR